MKMRNMVFSLLLVLFCLITPLQALALDEIFSDSFLTLSNWTVSAPGDWYLSGGTAKSAFSAADILYLTQEDALNCSGTVVFEFGYRAYSVASGGYFGAEVYDGSSWIRVNTVTATDITWRTKELDISSYANSSLKVRFVAYRAVINVDNVVISQGVQQTPPGAFNLTGPSNGATDVSVTPTLTWEASADATSYDVYYGQTMPSTPVANVTDTSYAIPAALAYNASYTWKVMAKNAAGEVVATGAPFAFTTLDEIFSDSFSTLSNWTVSAPGDWYLSGGTAKSAFSSADILYLTQEDALNCSGSVVFEFGYRAYSVASGGYFGAEVYDGSSWIRLYTVTATDITWRTKGMDISSYTNSSLKVRFVAYGAVINVDNVLIIQGVLQTPPGAFDLTGPANGTTGVSVTPTLSWEASTAATNYDVYCGTTSPGTLLANVTETSYTFAAPLDNNTYYWKIVAINSGGETTATGAPWSFTVGTPGNFALTAPANGATDVTLTPTLTWGASEGATEYDVYYEKISPSTLQATVTENSYTVPPNMAYGATYFWKVVAKNANGETIATGSPASFTTLQEPVPPYAFELTEPANGATNVGLTPALSWTAASGATSYDVYYGTTSPGTLIDNVTGNSYLVPSNLAHGTTYYWKVVAKNSYGETTSTGSPASFTTIPLPPAPGAFTLTGPANGETQVVLNPTLTWTASSDAESYDVYYGTTSPGVLQANVTGTSYAVGADLDAFTLYYWKVVAKNSNCDITAGNAPWSFTTGAESQMLPQIAEPTSTLYIYDSMDQIIRTEKTISGNVYITETNYDSMGRPYAVNYPDYSWVFYTYNNYNGGLDRIGDCFGGDQYLKSTTYNQYGLVTAKTLGNDVTINYTYDPNNFRLTNITATGGAGTVQNISYNYNNANLLTGIVDSKNSANWCYSYDDLYRLTNARRGTGTTVGGGTEIYSKAYAYNNIGNITSFEGNNYTYNDSAHKHAVTAEGANTYTYDANGNMLSGATRTFAWDINNKPISIIKAGVTTTINYGPDGERVKKTTGDNWNIYVGSSYEKDQAGVQTWYIDAGGTTVKKKADGSLFFILKDHLGGTGVITNSAGAEVSRQYYQPYGLDDMTGSLENEAEDHKFTGQEEDTETGLYNYNARLYDPALGRFISADPLQGTNRYAYCSNDPVNTIDPSGYYSMDPNGIYSAGTYTTLLNDASNNLRNTIRDYSNADANNQRYQSAQGAVDTLLSGDYSDATYSRYNLNTDEEKATYNKYTDMQNSIVWSGTELGSMFIPVGSAGQGSSWLVRNLNKVDALATFTIASYADYRDNGDVEHALGIGAIGGASAYVRSVPKSWAMKNGPDWYKDSFWIKGIINTEYDAGTKFARDALLYPQKDKWGLFTMHQETAILQFGGTSILNSRYPAWEKNSGVSFSTVWSLGPNNINWGTGLITGTSAVKRVFNYDSFSFNYKAPSSNYFQFEPIGGSTSLKTSDEWLPCW